MFLGSFLARLRRGLILEGIGCCLPCRASFSVDCASVAIAGASTTSVESRAAGCSMVNELTGCADISGFCCAPLESFIFSELSVYAVLKVALALAARLFSDGYLLHYLYFQQPVA